MRAVYSSGLALVVYLECWYYVWVCGGIVCWCVLVCKRLLTCSVRWCVSLQEEVCKHMGAFLCM